jgi:hypothetical protein
METITIDIINPKAKELLNPILTELKYKNFVGVREQLKEKSPLEKLLAAIRENATEEISLEEITAEVEIVRKARYANKKSCH